MEMEGQTPTQEGAGAGAEAQPAQIEPFNNPEDPSDDSPSSVVVSEEQRQSMQVLADYPLVVMDETRLSGFKEAMLDNLHGRAITLNNLPRIKVPAQGATTWNMPDGHEGIVQTIEGIIVEWTSPRAWWPDSIEESGGSSPPACSSADSIRGFGVITAEEDEAPAFHDCNPCPHNQWDTGRNGRGKACKEKYMLYVVQNGADGVFPSVVQIPATSLPTVGRYMDGLYFDGVSHWKIVSELTLEKQGTQAMPYSVLRIRRGEQLNAEEVTLLRKYREAITPVINREQETVASNIQRDAEELEG
jgi:hypothetical protein